jgi:hypothetical protein
MSSPKPLPSPTSQIQMIPHQLQLAAAHTEIFVRALTRFRAQAAGLGAESDRVLADPRVAAQLRATYAAWWIGLDVLINDGKLTAHRLAETAATTAGVDHEIAGRLDTPLEVNIQP